MHTILAILLGVVLYAVFLFVVSRVVGFNGPDR